MRQKVLAAMSGGVDSSVTAALLIEAGYQVSGVTLKMFEEAHTDPVADARKVADTLGIEHHVLDLSELFSENVITPFTQGYRSGITPNPCICCNRYIKFGALLEHALAMDMDYLATGHYARIAFDPAAARYQLKMAADPLKDQTYVLYSLTQRQLARALLPLGEYRKAEVREIAARYGFANAQKQESQEICFIPDHDYAAFIARNAGESEAPGDFVDLKGNVLGRHRGITHYTVGQRKGLGVSLGRIAYVVSIDRERNRVVLGDEKDLYSTALTVKELNIISGEPIGNALRVQAKIRYSAEPRDATFTPLDNGTGRIEFDVPQRAVTPGQAAVFYQGDTVIGGGIIAGTLEKV
ncbi:MAG: tRNA 2-thiouridine(34) synthase MnmA [Bacillota bacterium]